MSTASEIAEIVVRRATAGVRPRIRWRSRLHAWGPMRARPGEWTCFGLVRGEELVGFGDSPQAAWDDWLCECAMQRSRASRLPVNALLERLRK